MTMKKQVETYVGKKALYRPNLSLAFEVRILDVKTSYGKQRFNITPISGTGERWVEEIELIK